MLTYSLTLTYLLTYVLTHQVYLADDGTLTYLRPTYLLTYVLTHQVYLADDGTITGEHASECILPSTFGLTPATLTHGNRAQKA